MKISFELKTTHKHIHKYYQKNIFSQKMLFQIGIKFSGNLYKCIGLVLGYFPDLPLTKIN